MESLPSKAKTNDAYHRRRPFNVTGSRPVQVEITLSQPNDFTPAFQKYAEDHYLDYGAMQFVLGIPADPYHSHDIITKEQVFT